MGLDRFIMALPENAPLLSLGSGGGADVLHILPRYVRERHLGADVQELLPHFFSEAEREHVTQRIEQTLATMPDPHLLVHDLDRRWDALAYLLSGRRRADSDARRDPGWQAVSGAGELEGGGTSGQGIPLRWSSPQRVEVIASFLDRIDDEALRSHCDAPRMFEAGVYKVHESLRPDELWSYLSPHVEAIRRIYASAARLQYGTLVVTW